MSVQYFDSTKPTVLIGGPCHGEMRCVEDHRGRLRIPISDRRIPPHYGEIPQHFTTPFADYTPEPIEMRHGSLLLSGWVWLYEGLNPCDSTTIRLATSVIIAGLLNSEAL